MRLALHRVRSLAEEPLSVVSVVFVAFGASFSHLVAHQLLFNDWLELLIRATEHALADGPAALVRAPFVTLVDVESWLGELERLLVLYQ